MAGRQAHVTVCWPADTAEGLSVPPAPVLDRECSALWNHSMDLKGGAACDAAATSMPILMKARCYQMTVIAVYKA